MNQEVIHLFIMLLCTETCLRERQVVEKKSTTTNVVKASRPTCRTQNIIKNMSLKFLPRNNTEAAAEVEILFYFFFIISSLY